MLASTLLCVPIFFSSPVGRYFFSEILIAVFFQSLPNWLLGEMQGSENEHFNSEALYGCFATRGALRHAFGTIMLLDMGWPAVPKKRPFPNLPLCEGRGAHM